MGRAAVEVSRKLGVVLISLPVLIQEESSRSRSTKNQDQDRDRVQDNDPSLNNSGRVSSGEIAVLIARRVNRVDCLKNGYLLIGYPRTKEHVEDLDSQGVVLNRIVFIEPSIPLYPADSKSVKAADGRALNLKRHVSLDVIGPSRSSLDVIGPSRSTIRTIKSRETKELEMYLGGKKSRETKELEMYLGGKAIRLSGGGPGLIEDAVEVLKGKARRIVVMAVGSSVEVTAAVSRLAEEMGGLELVTSAEMISRSDLDIERRTLGARPLRREGWIMKALASDEDDEEVANLQRLIRDTNIHVDQWICLETLQDQDQDQGLKHLNYIKCRDLLLQYRPGKSRIVCYPPLKDQDQDQDQDQDSPRSPQACMEIRRKLGMPETQDVDEARAKIQDRERVKLRISRRRARCLRGEG